MKGNDDMWNLGGNGCLIGYCPGSTQDLRDQYAQYFVDFIHTYQANGIPIHAVGIQNEPNNITDYPGGNFTAADQIDFINRLKVRMATQSPPLTQKVWAEFCTCEVVPLIPSLASSLGRRTLVPLLLRTPGGLERVARVPPVQVARRE